MKGVRARMLGDAIPAESFATGANALYGRTRIVNHNMATYRKNGSPRLLSTRWKHSDIKNTAFYYVYSVFEEFIKERKR